MPPPAKKGQGRPRTKTLDDEVRELLLRRLPPGKTEQALYLTNALLRAEDIHDFLVQKLPPAKTNEALYITSAILKAAARYDRYSEMRDDWIKYTARKRHLNRMIKLLDQLAAVLRDLDILSRDELTSRCHPDLEMLLGSLMRLSKQAECMVEEAPKNGRPYELADERWIIDLANIYENAFCQSISDDLTKFRRFLETSRPASFARYGKLGLRQVKRTLERRKRINRETTRTPNN
jgi:hypothetical protein